MLPKILLAAPTSTYKDYIFLDWFIHASSLTYKNYDILICDNSHDKNYHKKLQKMGINCLYVSPEGKETRQYIVESQNVLREHFLQYNYDYFFSLEVDVFPPKNIIEKLLSCNKKIVGAPYFWKFGKESCLLISYFTGDNKVNTHETTLPEAINFVDGTVKQVYENGIGCTLISREIIEKIPFRWEKGNPAYSDTFFYKDLFKKGYKNYMDTSILCKHYNSDWGLNVEHMMSKDVVI